MIYSVEAKRFHWSTLSATLDKIGGSGMIKLLPGSCLIELEIVLKEPYTIGTLWMPPVNAEPSINCPGKFHPYQPFR